MRPSTLSIGDFSRATHLSVKALRYYHESGLLEPAEIDQHSGYRRYEVEQIPVAHIIRRFRDLDMPVEAVRAVLHAADPTERNELIGAHLRRLEDEYGRAQRAIASLRDLLEHPSTDLPVEHRSIPTTQVASVTADVRRADIGVWHQGALAELYATVAAQGLATTGLAGGQFGDGLFSGDGDTATMFLPVGAGFEPIGRLELSALPAVDLAVVAHVGEEDGIDRAYGALAAYVARHALALAGPIREFYPVNRHQTQDATYWRTEIGWPILATGQED
ncbi:MAG TPA: MerR family transcriptional regulator [Marmoricola sp.]|nr:MerR family transcriptional regulator [Marmoricola sp.]